MMAEDQAVVGLRTELLLPAEYGVLFEHPRSGEAKESEYDCLVNELGHLGG